MGNERAHTSAKTILIFPLCVSGDSSIFDKSLPYLAVVTNSSILSQTYPRRLLSFTCICMICVFLVCVLLYVCFMCILAKCLK